MALTSKATSKAFYSSIVVFNLISNTISIGNGNPVFLSGVLVMMNIMNHLLYLLDLSVHSNLRW
jgi:hypothetical protein